MAFDAFFLGCVLEEVRQLGEARVEKIHQPARDTVILHLKHAQGRGKLLLGANPAAPKLYLAQNVPENPAEPPMFCMLLRKHLSGARLVGVAQPAMERAVTLTFDCIDELGDRVQKRLVAEFMGRTCNLYLLTPEGRIIDCLRRVGLDETVKRPALPGMFYQPPAPVEKRDAAAMGVEDFENLISQPGPDRLSDRLMEALGGLSAPVCREAALYACGDLDARGVGPEAGEKLAEFFEKWTKNPRPCYNPDGKGVPKQFAFCPLTQYGPWQEAASFSALLEAFDTLRTQNDAMRQKSQAIRKTVGNLCARLTRKLAIQETELAATFDRERLRQLGDILTANLHRIQKGQTVIQCEDFYDEEMKIIEIPLSPILSPQQNAAKCYKDYARMKNAEKELTRQLELGRAELEYLHSVREELERVGTDQELEEIRLELQQGGYLRGDSGKKRIKPKKLPLLRLESTDGFPIFVGKNNRQNEELTFQLARKDDLWLHAQKVHGSHVIIACGGKAVPDDTVTQAAQLAAYYAETAGGQNVCVDVTPVRQVKKPPHAKPGMVIYHTYRTVVVNPYPDIRVDALNAEKKPE